MNNYIFDWKKNEDHSFILRTCKAGPFLMEIRQKEDFRIFWEIRFILNCKIYKKKYFNDAYLMSEQIDKNSSIGAYYSSVEDAIEDAELAMTSILNDCAMFINEKV